MIGKGKQFTAGMPISTPGFADMFAAMVKAWDTLTVHNGRVVWSVDRRPKIVLDAGAGGGASLSVYEATADERDAAADEFDGIDEGESIITAKAINADGTLVGEEIAFRTLAPYEPPEE
jgi:hypothetical protein